MNCMSYNPACFDVLTVSDAEGRLQTRILRLQDKYKPQGVSLINIDVINCHITVEMSAKILGADYLDGIHAGNIHRVIESLSVYKGNYTFRVDSVLESAFLLRCDVTDNLVVSRPVIDYLNALSELRRNDKYSIDAYAGSVVLRRKVTSYKERLIVYNKVAELQRKDDHLYGILLRNGKLDGVRDRLLRVESNLTSYKQMRNLFGVDDSKCIVVGRAKCVPLLVALQSSNRVNYTLLKKATDMVMSDKLRSVSGSFTEIEKQIGRETIIRECNYDIELIRSFIRQHVRGNVSCYVRRYKALMADMAAREASQRVGDNHGLVAELLQLLAG